MKRRHNNCCGRYIPLFAWYLHGFPFYISHFCLCVSFLGARHFNDDKLPQEAHWLEEEAQHLEMAGLGKLEAAVAGSEAEGLYGLLRGAISHPSISSAPLPPKKACHSQSATISHPPPQELAGAVPKASDPATKDVEQALEAVSPASEGSSPHPHATPSPSVGGHPKSIQMPG